MEDSTKECHQSEIVNTQRLVHKPVAATLAAFPTASQHANIYSHWLLIGFANVALSMRYVYFCSEKMISTQCSYYSVISLYYIPMYSLTAMKACLR